MKKIALISAILENPTENQQEFNIVVSENRRIVKGRMGLPFDEAGIAVVSIAVVGSMDEINSFTGKLGKIKNVKVKTAISKKELN